MTNLQSRASEIYSLDILNAYMTEKGKNVRYELEQRDPPDAWLTVNGTRYLVEVGRIIFQKEKEYDTNFFGFMECLNQQARERNLNGAYVLSFSGEPDFSKKTSRARQELVKQTLYKLSDLGNKPTGSKCILEVGHDKIRISRFDSERQYVANVGPTRASFFNGRHLVLLQARLDKKSSLLKKKLGENTRFILVLDDHTGSTPFDIEDALQSRLKIPSNLLAIFWISRFTSRGCFVYGEETFDLIEQIPEKKTT